MKKGTHHTKKAKEKNRLAHLGKPRAGNPENWKHTEETRKKMREVKLKKPVRYWLGKHRSEKTKEKISIKLKGRKLPIEIKKKISKKLKGRKGRVWTEEQKRKLSESLKGRTPWNKGLKGYKAGEEHYRWRKDLDFKELVKKIRICPQYKAWREKILKRDNFTCQKCGKRGGKLEVHHKKRSFIDILEKNKIKTFNQAIKLEELWDLENGETLCIKCHNLTKNGRRWKKT